MFLVVREHLLKELATLIKVFFKRNQLGMYLKGHGVKKVCDTTHTIQKNTNTKNYIIIFKEISFN